MFHEQVSPRPSTPPALPVYVLDRKAKLLGMDGPVKTEPPDGATRNRGTAGESQGGAASMDPIRPHARGLPGEI